MNIHSGTTYYNWLHDNAPETGKGSIFILVGAQSGVRVSCT